jgi:hypothetical protein
MPVCKWRFPALPLLTYQMYAALRFSENRHFRRDLTQLTTRSRLSLNDLPPPKKEADGTSHFRTAAPNGHIPSR